MKTFLFLALMLSSYSYAQSGHDHQNDTKKSDSKSDSHNEMHEGGHHGGMGGMHGDHHKPDKNTIENSC